MNSIHAALAVLLTTATCFGQGQVNFANRVGPGGEIVNAPVIFQDTLNGPGPGYTAQLLLVGANNSLTPLIPTATFGTDPTLPQTIRDMYWGAKTVEVPVTPGTEATFLVRSWQTSFGSYEQAQSTGAGYASSAPFVVTVGGGNLPPADLTTLKSFAFTFPEPSTITLGLLGAAALVVFGRRR